MTCTCKAPTVNPLKDSGIEWIGKIPQEWETGKMLYALSMQITDGPHETPELFDEGIPFISAEAVKNYKIDFNLKRGNISNNFYNECCLKYVPQLNDIFMIKSGATTGNIAIVETDKTFQIWSPLAVFRVNSNTYFKYLFYLLQSEVIQKQIQLNWSYGTQQNIGMRVLEKLICIFPPLPTQIAIADYLDSKVKKIDSTIEHIKQHIQKLKEYRQAVITESVTKGLNPNAPTKESGIEWIGKIPQDWEVKKIRFCFKLNTGLTITKENLIDDGVLCINYGEIHSKYGFDLDLRRDGLRCVSADYLKSNTNSLVTENDFVFCDTSEDIEGSGNFVYIFNVHENLLFAGSHTVACKKDSNFYSRFIAYLFKSTAWKAQIQSKVSGTKVYSISQKILKDTKAIFPLLPTQTVITDYLDTKTAQIDNAIIKKETLIQKLTEYKKSLIYEVVTGKKEVC